MSSSHLPAAAGKFAESQPDIWSAYTKLGEAVSNSGPLDADQRRLIKIAMAIGADSEGAVHSHVRQALGEGIAPEILRHVGHLTITTLGFPRAMRALSWIEDEIAKR